MRSQTVSTGCDGPEGEGRPRAPRRQDAIGARAGHGGIRRRARRCAVHGRSAGRACQGDGGRAVRGACAHVGLPSPAACCLGVGGGRVRVRVCKMFRRRGRSGDRGGGVCPSYRAGVGDTARTAGHSALRPHRHAASCRGDVPSARDNSRGGPFGGVQGVRSQATGCGA